MTDSFPLHWPVGWPRAKSRRRSLFKVAFEKACRELQNEVRLMGGRYSVLSMNVPRRVDGSPYASGKPENGDPGVALYFERKGKQMVFACDRWDQVKDNIRAVQKTMEALRAIDRWGASEMMERAFSAFEAIAPPLSWRKVLGLDGRPTEDQVNAAFREKARRAHPDAGGSTAAMVELNAARDAALREIANV